MCALNGLAGPRQDITQWIRKAYCLVDKSVISASDIKIDADIHSSKIYRDDRKNLLPLECSYTR